MSRYDGSDTYVYPGTEVLLNKADIREQAALDVFEADVTAIGQLVKPNSGYRRRMKRYLSTLANQRNPYSVDLTPQGLGGGHKELIAHNKTGMANYAEPYQQLVRKKI